MRSQNILIAVLQVYFLVMNVTVEREYCLGPLDPNSSTPFVQQAVDFGPNNPLFVERPEWLVKATCAHAYIMWAFYVLTFYLAVTEGWARGPLARVALPLFLGAKLYAISFYHYMEFTSHAPPPNLLPYWAAEGPYLLNIGLLVKKLVSVASGDGKGAKQQ